VCTKVTLAPSKVLEAMGVAVGAGLVGVGGRGVSVGGGVEVGGNGVAAGRRGVSVGGTCVGVGGAGVSVGAMAIAVADGGTDVAVGSGAPQAPIIMRRRMVMTRVVLRIRILVLLSAITAGKLDPPSLVRTRAT
jgi:hypothetical protein